MRKASVQNPLVDNVGEAVEALHQTLNSLSLLEALPAVAHDMVALHLAMAELNADSILITYWSAQMQRLLKRSPNPKDTP